MFEDHFDLAMIYRNVQPDSAITNLQDAITLSRDSSWLEGLALAEHQLGLVYLGVSAWDTALAHLRLAYAIDSRLGRGAAVADGLNHIGIAFKGNGKADSALRYFQHAVERNQELQRDGEAAVGLYYIGELFEDRNDHYRATAYFDSAVTKLSGEAAVTGQRRVDAWRRARYNEARAWCVREVPDSLVQVYRRAIAKDSSFSLAKNNLAWHYALLGQHLAEALTLALSAVSSERENPTYWDTLAEVYRRLGRFDDAAFANANAQQRASGNPDLVASVKEREARIRAKQKASGSSNPCKARS